MIYIKLFLNGTRSPLVKVDSEKCLQALLNILSNALRHAAHAIDISILERERQVWIDIKDDGEGIPEEVLPNLFQRFFQGEEWREWLGTRYLPRNYRTVWWKYCGLE